MKSQIKMTVDAAMTIMLLFLMAYERVGEAAHEWLGTCIFLLFLLHHFLNSSWYKNLFRGRYTPPRILQTVIVLLICATMLGSMLSGIILSRHVFSFLPVKGGRAAARVVHMLCAYWGFAFLSVHLGLHWGILLGIARKWTKRLSKSRKRLLRAAGYLLAGYGAFALVKRDIHNYMLLKSHFVFFDFEEPLLFFFADYIAVMGLFVLLGYSLTKVWKVHIKSDRSSDTA